MTIRISTNEQVIIETRDGSDMKISGQAIIDAVRELQLRETTLHTSPTRPPENDEHV